MKKDEITFPYTINYSIMTFWWSWWIFVLAIGLSLLFINRLSLLILFWLVCLLGIGYYGLLYRTVKDKSCLTLLDERLIYDIRGLFSSEQIIVFYKDIQMFNLVSSRSSVLTVQIKNLKTYQGRYFRVYKNYVIPITVLSLEKLNGCSVNLSSLELALNQKIGVFDKKH
ncbi:hypothetical protein [Lactococcus allomyrinae]|uniref:Uncharacterized protein n=1 Tax=Lactococcus allomyrinae TaxID=2419773 RepID=A0A387BPJ1_9LACT|nr:hypothetical protein [Lactococcus allomyrinae]AYG00441.1 hypothetical protein D7I46_04665 [Lactococcus allomyrinae]